jgi:hypothetical protein
MLSSSGHKFEDTFHIHVGPTDVYGKDSFINICLAIFFKKKHAFALDV